jgi:glucose/arabinose dehydrogenase
MCPGNIMGPDNRIWFTERNGHVSAVNPVNSQKKRLLTIADVHEQDESGLLGMALHPGFNDTPHVFVVYTYLSGSIKEKLVRYTWSSDTLQGPVVLLDNIPGSVNHNGSRLVITPDRKIIMSTGDAQVATNAQDTLSLAGKFLRLNLDGSVPADNPNPASLIWSFGHRNPQGMVLASNGVLYSSEHGPGSDDEINIILKDRNYGWPNVTGFCNTPAETTFCNANNVVEPLKAWTPTIATAGLDYYDHAAIPEWRNCLLMTNLKEADFRVFLLNRQATVF